MQLGRRTFLRDLGRVTLGAVVLGPALAGCSDTDEPGGAEPDGVGDGSTSTPTPATEGAAAGSGGLRWQRASFGFVSAYVLVRDGEALVFDTGTADAGVGPIGEALAAAGVGWDDVSTVLVSHGHGDHAGGVAAVVAEAPDVVVHGAMPDLDGFREAAGTAAEVEDGDVLLGVRVVATPGHTPGHVSAFDEASGLLLAGDAIVHDVAIGGTVGDGIEPSPPDFTADADAARASVGVLAGLGPTTILFGHGDPLLEGAAEELRTAAGSA